MDCDYTVLAQPYKSEKATELGSCESKIPLIRLFGLTEAGQSILVNVYGYLSYMYIAVPQHPPEMDDFTLCNNLKVALNSKLRDRNFNQAESVVNYVIKVEIVKKASIRGYYNKELFRFFKISLALPRHVPAARDILENEGVTLPGIGNKTFLTYESNIAFILRFMIDKKISGVGWIELKPNSYILTKQPSSSCQIEVDVCHDQLIAHEAIGDWAKVAPLRILSFDIECSSLDNSFPTPDKDSVIQIANYVTVFGNSEPIIKNVFVLGGCTPIVGADVRTFNTEVELLEAWKDFVNESDPDVITGYNIVNFDVPYLLDRARHLKIKHFPFMTRLIESPIRVKDSTFSSKAYGTRDSKEITMYGRVFFDVLQVVQRNYKLRSYTLNSVCAEFLGEQKEDVHHSIITKLFQGSDNDRRRLASYCLKDSYLPTRLIERLSELINYIEMARVTGVPFSYLLSRGQSIKVLSQLYRKANSQDLIIPSNKRTAEGMGTYEGATVIKPMKGYYEVPITTLDFSSLYPSIMMAHNLCYSTLISQSAAQRMNKDDYIVSPTGHYFVKSHVRHGILPEILVELISARSQARKEMASEKSEAKRAALNARQLALKISANSVYGFTGASVGSLPCLEVSTSVTGFGRDMIQLTAKEVEEEFTIKNGYKYDAEVIYGDTDSVMVKFGTPDIKEAMELGLKASKHITAKFIKPISLEFEKVYYPYLLISKKRYAGLLWTKPEKWDKLDAKGIETVRRDNCLLVKHVIDVCLKNMLVEKNPNKAIEFVKETIRDLKMNRLDISMLVITKALSKAEYKGKQAHVELNKKMEKRSEGESYNLGDRIPYIICKGIKGSQNYENAEDPIYVLENNIPIDSQYYLDMLSRPLIRIFSPILENPEASLLHGDHTRTISIPRPKKGGIIGFVTVEKSCQGCKASLSKDSAYLCDRCQETAPLIYGRFLDNANQKEREYSRLWSQCQECQGSFHQEVLCSARDCPIFYMRTKVHMDLVEARNQLEKFNLDW